MLTMLGLTAALALSQNGQDATPAAMAPAAETSAPETAEHAMQRAADAAEKAAQAAEKAAGAAQRIAQAFAAPEPAEAPKKESPWRGTIGVGLQFITGNTRTLTLTGNLAVERAWEVWRLGLKLNGAYAVSNPKANEQGTSSDTTARRAQALLRGDRKFGSFATVFLVGGAEFDHVKNIESRSFGELGTGLTFFDVKTDEGKERLFLRLDLAARAGYETRFQYFPTLSPVDPYGVVVLAPRAAVAFRWSLNSHVHLAEDLEFIPSILAAEAGRLLINNTTKLSAKVTENVALTTAVLVNFDSQPPQSAVERFSTDVALTAGLEATF